MLISTALAFANLPIRSLVLMLCLLAGPAAHAATEGELAEVRDGLKKAMTFFSQEVSVEGGYVYLWSNDLKYREGEGVVDDQTVWIEPPSTPTVGEAFLYVHQATGDPLALQAARNAVDCLLRGQLISGGWDNSIVFEPAARSKMAYRVDSKQPGRRNVTTLDDDKTQSAIRFLMRMDQQLKMRHRELHEACIYALDHLLEAQYANGAWPQRFDAPPKPDPSQAGRKASFPETWSRTFPAVKYQSHFTLNDDTLRDTIRVMMLAHTIYDDVRYKEAALKAGQFILDAQLPSPQPAWAQQYDAAMHPVWARKFEPPAVSGGESQGMIQTLLELHEWTGDPRYLAAIEKALGYLESCLLPDGRLARFHEMRTNRPLYFTRDYQLTYSDADMPTHYGFKVSSKLESLRKRLEKQQAKVRVSGHPSEPVSRFLPSNPSRSEMREALTHARSLDSRGAWPEKGDLKYHREGTYEGPILSSRTFIRRIEAMAKVLQPSK